MLEKFVKKFSEGQNRKTANVDISDNIDSSLRNSRVLVKNPNVGRPSNSISRKAATEAEISQAIIELLGEKLDIINNSFEIEDLLVIRKKELCEKLSVSRPTINKRFEELSLDLDELVNGLTEQFIKKNQNRMRY